MIWHLHIAWDGYRFGTPGAAFHPRPRAVLLWLDHGALPPEGGEPVSLPPNAEALRVSLHFWAGF